MSSKKKKGSDMVILYHEEEARMWMEYIQDCLKKEKQDLKLQIADINACLSNITSLCSDAAVISILLSPLFVEVMISEVDILKPCLNSCVVAVIELFIEDEQFEAEIAPRYSVEKWKRFSIGEHESENKQTVKDIVEIVNETTKGGVLMGNLTDELNKILKQQGPPKPAAKPNKLVKPKAEVEQPKEDTEPDPVESKEEQSKNGETSPAKQEETAVKPKSLTLPRTEKSILKDVCPDSIRKADERVVLVFRREISEGSLIQVKIDDQIYDTSRLNPYCYLFQAPEHPEGKVAMYLYYNGKKECKRPIHYLSPSNLAYTCPQYIMELLRLPDLRSLDKHLTNMFTSSTPHDEALAHIFTPKNLLTTTGQKKSTDMLPTLLHFACYYGLQDLCMALTEFPGGHFANEIVNEKKMTPIDLAREQGFGDIVQYLETFLEMHNYITNLEDIYEKISGKSLNPNADGYMYMRGQKDPYGYGRFASSTEDPGSDYEEAGNVEDPYEIKAIPSGAVEEVAPEEDLQEDDMCPLDTQAPKRPPRLDRDGSENDAMQQRNQAPKRPPKNVKLPVKDPMFGNGEVQPAEAEAPQRPPKGGKPEMPDPIFGEVITPPHTSLGSTRLDELRDLQESFKRGELNLDDIETLYKAWRQRNQGTTSSSIKEREHTMQQVKKQHMHVIKKAEENTKMNVLKKKSKKFSAIQALNIQHNVSPNTYDSWSHVKSNQLSGNQECPSPSNRDSTTSTSSMSSVASSSSSSSRGSHLELMREEEEEQTPTPPPRPVRTMNPKPSSRLPTPPMPLYSGTPKVPPKKF